MRWHRKQRWSLQGSTHSQWSGERRGGRRPPWQEAHHWWSLCLAACHRSTKASFSVLKSSKWCLGHLCWGFKGELTMPQSDSASSTPMYSKKLAKPSLSHRSSHQSIVTMFPNHWKTKTIYMSFEDPKEITYQMWRVWLLAEKIRPLFHTGLLYIRYKPSFLISPV